jgi:chemotaxis protein MotB
MARRKHDHEDHVNHEAWAIPYGDLITLLLAFFVVMYAVSSVNEGKYRVLSDSLVAAFRGQPHTLEPVSIGNKVAKVQPDDSLAAVSPKQALKFEGGGPQAAQASEATGAQLREMAADLAAAMQDLVDRDLIRVERNASWIEVEIKTDILFPSGSAEIDPAAIGILDRVATILATRSWPVRVEGHTDDRPINTPQFPSNWELSAARAARIVRLLQDRGIAPARLVVEGLGEHAPVGDNGSPEGRNRNRRVVMVILGGEAPAADPPPDAVTPDAVTPGATTPGAPAAGAATPGAGTGPAEALPAGPGAAVTTAAPALLPTATPVSAPVPVPAPAPASPATGAAAG